MNPVFCCGFECGQLGSVGQHWESQADASINTNISFVRSGSRSVRINPTASAGGFTRFIGFAIGNFVARGYVYFSTLPNVDCAIFAHSAGVNQGGIFFKSSDSKLYAGTSSANLGSSGIVVTTGQWYRLDFFADIDQNPWVINAQVDGVALGQATLAVTSALADRINIGSGALRTADEYYDDIVISGTAGDYPIGPGYVNHFVPTADGTHNVAGANDFERTLTGVDIVNATTDAYLLVDDVPLESSPTDWIGMEAPPNATDYVECIFGAAPGISTPTNPPRSVEVIAGIHQAATGAGNMEIRMNDNGTTNALYTANGVAGVTSIVYKRKHYPTAIAGGGAWVISGGGNGDFTNLRVRFGSPAALDVNPDQYFDCIMIEAEFEEIAVIPPIPNKIYKINQAINRASTF